MEILASPNVVSNLHLVRLIIFAYSVDTSESWFPRESIDLLSLLLFFNQHPSTCELLTCIRISKRSVDWENSGRTMTCSVVSFLVTLMAWKFIVLFASPFFNSSVFNIGS